MIDLTTMLAAMKEEPWATWLAVADAMEEAGDKRADGLRMLAKFKLYPQLLHTYKKWCWSNRNDNFLRYPQDGSGRYRLPEHVSRQLLLMAPTRKIHFDQGAFIPFPSLMEAIIYAAEAWSREIQKRDDGKRLTRQQIAEMKKWR